MNTKIKELYNDVINQINFMVGYGMLHNSCTTEVISDKLIQGLSMMGVDEPDRLDFTVTLSNGDASIRPLNLYTFLALSYVFVPYRIVCDLCEWETDTHIFRCNPDNKVCTATIKGELQIIDAKIEIKC